MGLDFVGKKMVGGFTVYGSSESVEKVKQYFADVEELRFKECRSEKDASIIGRISPAKKRHFGLDEQLDEAIASLKLIGVSLGGTLYFNDGEGDINSVGFFRITPKGGRTEYWFTMEEVVRLRERIKKLKEKNALKKIKK